MSAEGNGEFDPDKQAAYLENLHSGHGRTMAARNIGVAPGVVERYAKAHPEYAAEIERAEIAAIEKVENALYMAAESGNVTACIFLLCNISRRATIPAYKDKWVGMNRPGATGKGGYSDEDLERMARPE